MKLAALCTLSLFGCTVVHGCVDTSPIDYHPPPRDGGILSDAAIFGEGGLIAACRECVITSCSDQYTECLKHEKCTKAVNCLMDSYCLNYDVSNLANLPPCLVQCSLESGILSADDPAIVYTAPVLTCSQLPETCASVCNVR